MSSNAKLVPSPRDTIFVIWGYIVQLKKTLLFFLVHFFYNFVIKTVNFKNTAKKIYFIGV